MFANLLGNLLAKHVVGGVHEGVPFPASERPVPPKQKLDYECAQLRVETLVKHVTAKSGVSIFFEACFSSYSNKP